MKIYLSNIIPQIQQYSKKLDDLTLLMNQQWVVIDEMADSKVVYIFMPNDELLISQNGIVEEATWKYLGNGSLLIRKTENSYLFKHGFFDENILALKIDGNDGFTFLANESKYEKELNSIENITEFLKKTYTNTNSVLIDYKSPNYEKTKEATIDSIFGSKREKYKINFADGESGDVHLIVKSNEAYFRETKFRILPIEHHYKDFNFCVNALHYYLKNGEHLNVGYITSL